MRLGKNLGVRQNVGMVHAAPASRGDEGRARCSSSGGSDSGPVEVDETFVGGKVKNMHKSKIKAKFHGKRTRRAVTARPLSWECWSAADR